MGYVKPKVASEYLGISLQTLRRYASEGRIKYISGKGGNRLYDIISFTGEQQEKEKIKYIYCRVSSNKQKDDLERQVSYLQEKYPEHKVVREIASGINFKRKGLQKILEQCTNGLVQEIVVTHRDRLCRIAWDHFQWLFTRYNVTIMVDGDQDRKVTDEQEMAEDLLSIIHVFSCKHYDKRRKSRKTEVLSGNNQETQETAENDEQTSEEE